MKNKLLKMILMSSFFAANAAISATAMDATLPVINEDEYADVTITANVPDDFTEDITVYFGDIPEVLYYSPSKGADSYTVEFQVEKGEYDINVVSYTDINNSYSYETVSTFNTSNESTLEINVNENSDNNSEYEEEISDHEGLEFYTPETESALFDFSNGESYGTLNVKAENFSAIKSFTFTLNGDGNYTITLDREHLFEAEVRLPEGSYYEISTTDIELDEDAFLPDGMSLILAHPENLGNFGNYYNISPGSVSEADLTILMIYNSEVNEFNSNLLFMSTMQENKEKAAENHREQIMESVFGESETETIASAEPEESNELPMKAITSVAVVLLIICAVAIPVYIYKKKH